jgi:outer membrane protein assembly factor BamB
MTMVMFAVASSCAAASLEDQAGTYLDRIGVERGICVLLAEEPAKLAIELVRLSDLTIYVQLPDRARVAATRQAVDEAGLLGTRIYVEKGTWSRVHLADNLADAVVVNGDPVAELVGNETQLLRVVRPLGKVLLGEQELYKPYPNEADDWTHPYHGPDNNPQSMDKLARAPYLTQFLAKPYYVPFPEVTVTSSGKIFRAFGHVGYKQRDWPWVNKLIALNGYNGTLLWQRSLEEGFNIHRSTMVATPHVLYLADSTSCKLLDTGTGQRKDEIFAPANATGPVWKWMSIADGVLYALVGEPEFRDETLRGDRTNAGWPWRPMTAGYDRSDYGWGFGRTLFAVDLESQKVLWTRIEQQMIDARAIAMKNDRIYYYSHPNFLACIDTRHGKLQWKNHDANLLEAIGLHERAQTARLGFASTAYMKCSDEAIYFAGPQRPRLVAASTDDGRLLWQLPHGNYQLVLRDEGLYAMGRTGPSRLIHPLSGEILTYLECVRGNCTRATGTADSIFCRGHDHAGTLRLSVPDHQPRRIALMRPDCHGGVIAAGGLLYWGPWMCDCSLSLVGSIGLAPAGDFSFGTAATDGERLVMSPDAPNRLKPLLVEPGDWPTYRSDNARSGASRSEIPMKVKFGWRHAPPPEVDSTAPVMAGGLLFVGGSDGIVRALDAASGSPAWKAYTAGPILFPPSIHDDRLFVGSGDGWIYAFEAATGKPLWRFRAAPVHRKINTYGRLTSTWPVASGVLADRDTVFAAAGIASYDGTHVYALDASTGRMRWQNNTSGQFFGGDRATGVSVQGHLLLHQDRLYLAGGNVISPAIYDTANGRCLNDLVDEWGGQKPPADPNWQHTQAIREEEARQKRWGKAPRGCDLFLIGDKVVAFDRLLYAPKEYWVGRYFAQQFLQAGIEPALIRTANDRVFRMAPGSTETSPKAVWSVAGLERVRGIAVGTNASLIAGQSASTGEGNHRPELRALSLDDGHTLWSQPLPAEPIWWGVAVDRTGHIAATLQDGSVVCLAPGG